MLTSTTRGEICIAEVWTVAIPYVVLQVNVLLVLIAIRNLTT